VKCNINGEFNDKYGIDYWPPVYPGEYSETIYCYGNDVIKWLCLDNGKFDESGPNHDKCWIDALNDKNLSGIDVAIESLEIIEEKIGNYNKSLTFKAIEKIITILFELLYFVDNSLKDIQLEISFNIAEKFMNLFNILISQKNAWNNVTIEESTETASKILLYIQNTAFFLSKSLNNRNTSFRLANENMITKIYLTNFSEEIEFKADDSSIKLPKNVKFDHISPTCFGSLINHMGNYLINGINETQYLITNIIAFSTANNNKINRIKEDKKVNIR
jgi:hypothetical protein